MSNLSDKLLFWRALERQHERDVELYEAIKAEPGLAPKSKKLGVRSLTFSLIFLFIIAAAIGGIALILLYMMDYNIFLGLFLIIAIVVIGFYVTIVMYIRAFRLMILQFKVNKTAISWVAMVFTILPTLIVAVMIFIFVSLSVTGQ
ncbi:MAG: hypothetical protein J1G07_03480 [Clostridiales bacterium]|nr:hypothetical protein [Clostridiales bacterium]